MSMPQTDQATATLKFLNDQFTNGGYPPFGAALTIVLMVLLSLLMVFYLRSASRPSEVTA